MYESENQTRSQYNVIYTGNQKEHNIRLVKGVVEIQTKLDTQNETGRLTTLHDFIAAVKIYEQRVDGTFKLRGIQIDKTFEDEEIQCFQDL